MSAYDVLETLSESSTLEVVRSRKKDGHAVILKRLAAHAGPQVHRRFRHEYELLRKIDLSGVVKAFGIMEADGDLVMELEDIGGQLLKRILAPGETFSLELAAGLADTLAGLHGQWIIHKGINPAHIVLNKASGRFQLIGFGGADELPQSEAALQPHAAIERNLHYIAPEQTGRMNRRVDYRTDFSSMGATFYQLLPGGDESLTGSVASLFFHCRTHNNKGEEMKHLERILLVEDDPEETGVFWALIKEPPPNGG